MTKLLIGTIATVTALAATMASGQVNLTPSDKTLYNGMDVKVMTPEETAKFRAQRDAAKAKWDAMTPEEKAAITKSARGKKLSDLNQMEVFGADDDLQRMSREETAQMKAEREAAKAKWDKMTPDEKAAAKKAAQQKRLSEMNAAERASAQESISGVIKQ
ncbi:MAG TPA: hypothetical protein VKG21_00480 [Casimicrobiaceae bacterium]|nr:hypothetical protein [Casimicrobiaceae bacterium]